MEKAKSDSGFNLRTKFALLSVLTSLVLVVAIFLVARSALAQGNAVSLTQLEQSMRSDFDLLIKNQVETTVAAIDQINQRAVNGEITTKEAKKLAADLVREMRYGENGYFWIDDYEGTNVVVLGNDTEGTNRLNAVDVNGVPYVQDFLANGQLAGGGFSDYEFPREGSDVPLPKRGYTLAYEPFSWVIGTGNYTDDIDALILSEEKELNRSLVTNQLLITAVSIGMLLLIVLISLIFTTRMIKPIQYITAAANKIKTGDVDVAIKVNSRDEIGVLGQAFSEMIEYFKTQAAAVESVSRGDLSVQVVKKSEKDVLSASVQNMIATLNQMVDENRRLTHAATQGLLMTRGDAGKFQGAYRDIVEGVNLTLETITAPIKEAEGIMTQMAQNDFTRSMSSHYQGMLKDFADSINHVREQLLSVQDAFVRVSLGDFSRYDEFVGIGKRSENDYLMPAIIEMMRAIMSLSDEVEKIGQAVVQGDLDFRGRTGQFSGSYARVIENLNAALDGIAGPIEKISAVLLDVSKGDLSVRMQGQYGGRYAVMQDALNTTVQSTQSLISEIVHASEQVSMGARQVSDGSVALSQGSTEQASSVEELSASMTQIAVQTRQNASNANQANQLAVTANHSAEQGNSQMKNMMVAMTEINEASGNIAKIIKVIDDIAFQTNILALNAAVEAARAGQHGKGFAVVAEEVRNLAARSAEAAKETTEFIETTISKVNGGTKIARETSDSLASIVVSTNQVATLVHDIATASNEQASGIAQINTGIDQVSRVVQANSATAEESAAASEELLQQAQGLTVNVRRFTL